jgi:23S rRNA (guanosine2251-2'-O)-methyltransferase
MSNPLLLEGSISVLAALEANRREIHAVYLQKDKSIRGASRIHQTATERGIQVHASSEAEIGELSNGSSHGGVLALAGERKFQSLLELLEGKPDPFIVMLEGVEDPYNYGQAIRALYAAGAAGIVVPERNWDTALNTVTRASAGASEYMPTAKSDSIAAIDFFKSRGFKIAATAKEKNSVSIYTADLRGALLMLIGGEKRGLAAAALAQCDVLLSIPYARTFEASLDVTSSTAALAFEVMRQRASSH